MQNITVSTEREAQTFVIDYRPRHNIAFLRPSGKPIAAWVVIAGIGELYTPSSIKTRVGKKSILTYNFWESIFSGEIYAQKESAS